MESAHSSSSFLQIVKHKATFNCGRSFTTHTVFLADGWVKPSLMINYHHINSWMVAQEEVHSAPPFYVVCCDCSQDSNLMVSLCSFLACLSLLLPSFSELIPVLQCRTTYIITVVSCEDFPPVGCFVGFLCLFVFVTALLQVCDLFSPEL